MTAPHNEAALRHWLVDYLITTIGCSPDEIDFESSLKDLGVGSSDSVVMSGELSELLGRTVSPVEFWEHPTINALARFLASPDQRSVPEDTAPDPVAPDSDEAIAVVGLGCRFPGGIAGPEALWRFLADGESAVGEVPAERWGAFDDGSPEVAAALARTTRWGAFLDDVEAFDAAFFEISPREAAKMDPQQRLLLEVAWEALEHAGIAADSLRHSQTGVFVGACVSEYGFLASTDLPGVDAWTNTGGALSIIANRLSYLLDLRGPSLTVDTACSSSLVALHLACQSLRSRDSQVALVGGVNLLLSPAVFHSFDQVGALSPTGQCHAFDARADGFVRGEGCGVVVLKRLSDAQRDGDRVLAVVRGSAVNQDGRSNGLMAPNPAAQMAVLRAAYANAGIEARDVDYVEAHGTGTLLGDPIEARALGTVVGRGRPVEAPLLVGAVKSNLGHLEAAAGIAGFIKAVLAVERGHIPANLGFETPNPHIPFDQLRLKVVAEQREWPAVGRPRRAGVSSFGFGGTNAHVVLEQAPVVAGSVVAEPVSVVSTLVVSGKTPQRVAALAGVLAGWVDGVGADVALGDVAHTLNHHRARYPVFGTVAACDRAQAVAGLRALAGGYPAPGVVAPHEGSCRSGVVFVYSGQGSQWAGMGRRLLAEEPAFAVAVAELEPVFVEQVGFSLRQVLESGEPVVGIDRIQPVLVGVQLALTELWRAHGVRPDAVIGHSMGEVAAAVVAGALTPADGLKVIATRSRLMARLSGQGAMALLELDAEAAEALIAGYPEVTVAVYASPRQSVIAGPPEQVDAVIAVVAAQDRLARRIEVDVASHHPIIDPILPELRELLADLAPRTPTIPVITTAVPREAAGTVRFDADYWAANLRNPVRFADAVAAAGVEHGVFVEVSPHPVLTYAIDDTLAQVHHHSIGTLARDSHDTWVFHTNLNATHTTQPPSTERAPKPHSAIPTTPWHRTRHWVGRHRRTPHSGARPNGGTLLGEHISVATSSPTQLWRAHLVPEAKPYPGSHRIHGLEVVPVSVLLETLAVAAAEIGTPHLRDVRFEYPVAVDAARVVQVIADGDSITVSSSPVSDAPAHRWVRHVSARCSALPADPRPQAASQPAADHHHVNGEMRSVAELLDDFGIEGQPFEWTVDSVRRTESGAVARVRLPEPSPAALLDAAVHVARLVEDSNPRLMVPAGVESVWLARSFTAAETSVEIHRRGGEAGELIVDIVAHAPDGEACIDIRSLRYADVDARPEPERQRHADPHSLAHAIEWQPWHDAPDLASPPADPGTVAVVGSAAADRDALAERLLAAGYRRADVADAQCVLYLAEPAPAGTDLDAAVRMSGQVSELVRELAGRDDPRPPALWILTRGVRDASADTALPQSCLWGIAAVIAAEQPQLWGGLLDVPADTDPDNFAAALAATLASPARSILAFDEGRLLTPVMAPVSGTPVRDTLRCRPDAAYLVTGGMGALGLLTAGWLVDRGARRLILAGRTALPPRREWDSDTTDGDTRRKIAAIRALELRGVAVEAVALDIGSPDAVRELVARRDSDGAAPIRGIVHAAGITENKLLTDTTADTLRRVMRPKVAGARALHEVFPPGCLDFFYLTASAGTVFGVPGQGAYAAANAYLDGLARTRHAAGCHTLSLDWVAWEGLGFAAEAQIVTQELRRLGSRPVTPDEAFAAWEYVDRYDVARAVMVPMPSSDDADGRDPDAPAGSAAPAWAEMTHADMLRALEAGLQSILARELLLPEDELQVDLPFAELGLNSVMAMSIRREAEQLVGLELSATMLWNHPTVEALAVHLAEKLAPPRDPASADEPAAGEDDDSADGVLDSLFDSVEAFGIEGEI